MASVVRYMSWTITGSLKARLMFVVPSNTSKYSWPVVTDVEETVVDVKEEVRVVIRVSVVVVVETSVDVDVSVVLVAIEVVAGVVIDRVDMEDVEEDVEVMALIVVVDVGATISMLIVCLESLAEKTMLSSGAMNIPNLICPCGIVESSGTFKIWKTSPALARRITSYWKNVV
jgi:hypothetical protein